MNKLAMAAVLVMFGGVMQLRADQSKTEVQERLNDATTTLRELSATPDQGIPEKVYNSAKCIAVVPRMVKGGFIIGGKHGRGVATCRLANGMWSAPAFFSISGGSWGLQAGVEDVDLVMMFMTPEGAQHLMQNKFQIGGSVSGAAGPVGRHASAGIDWKADTQILTYSRSKGLFAGIDLSGSWIEHDADSTTALYGKNVTTTAALTGQVPVPMDAKGFVDEVDHMKTVAETR
jgi:lipid-binding SYLF domain-containing protein